MNETFEAVDENMTREYPALKNGRTASGFALTIASAASVVAMLILQTASFAQGLKDPMRPSDYADPVGAAPAGSAAPAASGSASGLQLVKTTKGRMVAVIDGQTVRVGQKVGDATLIALSENTAVLRDAEGQRVTLRMYPDVDKTTPGAKPRVPAAKGAK